MHCRKDRTKQSLYSYGQHKTLNFILTTHLDFAIKNVFFSAEMSSFKL